MYSKWFLDAPNIYLTSLTLKNKTIQTLRERMEEICLNLDMKNDILSKNQ